MKIRLFVFSLLFALYPSAKAQLSPINVNIPMTDGKTLAGDVYLPNGSDTFPTILIMTPYNKQLFALNGLPLGVGINISKSKYAFLVVDWRCRFASVSACVSGSDNGDDGYDVVEWAASQSWSDGKIGMWGPSALGNVQFQTANKQPPKLVCCVPEVAAPHFTYGKYYPGGALTLERLETLNKLFPGSFTPVFANPHKNFIWDIAESITMDPGSIKVPMLLVGGWYDGNIDQTIYISDSLSKRSPKAAQHKTLIGPWVHGGTGIAYVGSSIQGEMTYPGAAGWNVDFAMEFFDYHMRGIQNGWNTRERYTYFQMGDDQWNSSNTWPPTGGTKVSFYLHDDNSLQTTAPTSSTTKQSFEYDPKDPSPTRGGKTLNLLMVQGPYDQSDSVESRSDNLIFSTPVLTQDLIVKGTIKVNLFMSSDRLDTDLALRLTEVYPDGRSMLLSDQIQRMRFRDGYRIADTSFIIPGKIYQIPILLEELASTFKKGNKLRLIISSSNYPRYNRNMNTGDDIHPNNNPDTLVNPLIATNSIYLNSTYASNIELPIGINSPLALNSQKAPKPLNIYPNPASEIVVIEYNTEEPISSTIDIYSSFGQLVYTSTIFKTKGIHRFNWNCSQVISGLYMVRITRENSVYTGRVIIK